MLNFKLYSGQFDPSLKNRLFSWSNKCNLIHKHGPKLGYVQRLKVIPQKVKNLQKEMILYKHQIFYTVGTCMGAPKENKRLDATSQQRKTWLYPFKSSPIYLSTVHTTHINASKTTFHALHLLLFSHSFNWTSVLSI